MEYSTAPVTAAAAGVSGTNYDVKQIGIGAGGLAVALLFCVMLHRLLAGLRKNRAERDLLAASRLQEAIEAALAAREAATQPQTSATSATIADPGTTSKIAPGMSDERDPREPSLEQQVEPAAIEPEEDPPVLREVLSVPQDPRKSDPKYLAARRLLDALHHAERDVEPFLKMVESPNSILDSDKCATARQVLVSWHEAVQRSRNALQEIFSRNQLLDELPSSPPAADIGGALSRLYHHAAFFTAMLTVQNKTKSPILSLSKQLPAAAMQLYWNSQTQMMATELQSNPLPNLPEASPSGRPPTPATPTPDNGDFQALLKLAIGGGHAAH